jgi:hypothetical protein
VRLSLRGALAAAVLLVLTACGSTDTPAAPSPSLTPSTTPSATPTTTPSSVPSSAAPVSTADVTVDVTIANGKVSAGGHAVVKAKPGQKVRINGLSDIADSLHVHGYDKTLDLKPGKPASVEFTTSTKGIFEVETHETGKLVFKLQVS